MTITICDSCGKKIPGNEHVVVGTKSIFNAYAMCNSCGKAVIALVKKLESKKKLSKKTKGLA